MYGSIHKVHWTLLVYCNLFVSDLEIRGILAGDGLADGEYGGAAASRLAQRRAHHLHGVQRHRPQNRAGHPPSRDNV